MEIKKASAINSPQAVEKKHQAKKVAPDVKIPHDNVDLTKSAKTQALYQKAMDIILKTPELRMDKIEAAKNTLNNLNNPSDEMLSTIAQKILNEFTQSNNNI